MSNAFFKAVQPVKRKNGLAIKQENKILWHPMGSCSGVPINEIYLLLTLHVNTSCDGTKHKSENAIMITK
uniref:Uncharacterized protein n=1 Tax=Romanomermis culicivorax TaxID=13658 RepID=A0A915JI49_ROMCU